LLHGEPPEIEDLLGLIWLIDDRERSGSTSPVAGRGIGQATDDDDREHVSAASHGFEKLDTVHPRHVNIEDRAVAVAGTAGLRLLLECEALEAREFALPALVRFRFLALEDVIDAGDDAAGPVLQLGSDLIVGICPGEGLEHIGRGRFGFHNPHQHRVIELTNDLDNLGGCRRSGNLLHQTLPPGIAKTV
jgi:hypothetical protein